MNMLKIKNDLSELATALALFRFPEFSGSVSSSSADDVKAVTGEEAFKTSKCD